MTVIGLATTRTSGLSAPVTSPFQLRNGWAGSSATAVSVRRVPSVYQSSAGSRRMPAPGTSAGKTEVAIRHWPSHRARSTIGPRTVHWIWGDVEVTEPLPVPVHPAKRWRVTEVADATVSTRIAAVAPEAY